MSSVSGAPWASIEAPPNGCSSKVRSSATAASTSSAEARTSGPIPSPGRVTIVGMGRAGYGIRSARRRLSHHDASDRHRDPPPSRGHHARHLHRRPLPAGSVAGPVPRRNGTRARRRLGPPPLAGGAARRERGGHVAHPPLEHRRPGRRRVPRRAAAGGGRDRRADRRTGAHLDRGRGPARDLQDHRVDRVRRAWRAGGRGLRRQRARRPRPRGPRRGVRQRPPRRPGARRGRRPLRRRRGRRGLRQPRPGLRLLLRHVRPRLLRRRRRRPDRDDQLLRDAGHADAERLLGRDPDGVRRGLRLASTSPPTSSPTP